MMSAYVIRRVLLLIPTIFLVTVAVFFLIRFMPGDIIDAMVQDHMRDASMQGDD